LGAKSWYFTGAKLVSGSRFEPGTSEIRSNTGTNSTVMFDLRWLRHVPAQGTLWTQKNAEKFVIFSHTANTVSKLMQATDCT
jgi:hypothetical protein